MCPVVSGKSTGKRKQQQPFLIHPGTLLASTYQKTLLELPTSSALRAILVPKPRAHPCSHSPSSCHTAWCWGPSRTFSGHSSKPGAGWCLDLGSNYGLWSLVPSSGWDAGSRGLAADVEVRNLWWGKKGEEESLECQLRITRGLG